MHPFKKMQPRHNRASTSHSHLLKWQRFVFSGELLALVTFIVYLLTLCPGIYGFDSAELATGVYTQGIVHPPGFPLYMLIGKIVHSAANQHDNFFV